MTLTDLNRTIIECQKCPRLIQHCQRIAREKRPAYREWEYWGRPVPGFGDPDAELLIIGLAPAAHGANRTGRMFTGDRSGEWLYRALYQVGLANQQTSRHRQDGLRIYHTYITAVVHCAPPKNTPTRTEQDTCMGYLEETVALLRRVKVVMTLGRIAFHRYLTLLKKRGEIASASLYPFAHGAFYPFPPPLPTLCASYHPSQQNTFTGRLTEKMLHDLFREAKERALS